MLRMDTVHVVRHKVVVERLSQRHVAEHLGISRNTVSKYLEVSEPRRVETKPRPKPTLERVAARIDRLLEEWEPRTTPKQRITAARVFRQLREEGLSVGKTTVSEYLRERRRQKAEVFIPLLYRPGEVAQVDFFEVTVEEAGVVRKVWKFLMHMMSSGFDFVWLYEHCDQLAFLDGHVRAFNFFNGVCKRGVYDNLTAAIRRRVGAEPRLSDRFAALASHYLFEPCFARPYQGHDKGGVESRGKGVRLQQMVPIPRGATLSAIAEQLLANVHAGAATRRNAGGLIVLEAFEEERRALRALPEAPFDPSRFVPVSVSSKATVQVEGATYSVPASWARLDAVAYVGVEDLRIVCRGEVRLYPKARKGERVIRYRDYLPELQHKPQAVRQIAPELLEELGEPWARLWDVLVSTHGEREAARVLTRMLAAVVKHGEEAIRTDLERALSKDGANLLALRTWLHDADVPERVAVPEVLSGYEVEAAQARDYDWMLEGGGVQ
jgi:transposase